MTTTIKDALGLKAWQRQDPPDLIEEARRIGTAMKKRTGYRTEWDGKPDASLTSALREACLMVARMRRGLPGHWLTLSGTNGSGKTMLARWIASQMEIRLPSKLLPRFWTMAELKRAYLGGGWALGADLAGEPWLVVDEVGVERENASFREAVLELANRRLGQWTVWTTNLSEAELEQAYSSRLTSRMIRDGNVHMRVTAPDFFTR